MCISMRTLYLSIAVALIAMMTALVLVPRQISVQIESAYMSFNSGNYGAARKQLRLGVLVGRSKAKDLLATMYGLGLGGPVDMPRALLLIGESSDGGAKSLARSIHYLGRDAAEGVYGPERVELGKRWLAIAEAIDPPFTRVRE